MTVQELENKILHHDSLYHNGQSEITDEEYDALRTELGKLDPENEVLKTVGSKVTSLFNKVKHEIPMGSLDKIITDVEFKKFSKECVDGRFTWSVKADGISVSLKYWNGRLRQAVTRGDGIEGEDITANVMKMSGFPIVLPIKANGFIRAEIIILKSVYNDVFKNDIEPETGLPVVKNERNGASGIARRKTGGGQEHLTLRAFNLEVDGVAFQTKTQQFEYLEKVFKFPTVVWGTGSYESIKKVYEKYQESEREATAYLIDGMVIDIDDLNRQEFLGVRNNRPKGARAYKFVSETVETVLEGIVEQVGRTGAITPVAQVSPVLVGGVTVTRATLHNYKMLDRLGLKIGQRVLLKRAGDVIPEIVKPLNDEGSEIKVPTECPACDGDVAYEMTTTNEEGMILKCLNHDCPAKSFGSLLHWTKEVGIKEIGPKLIEALEEAGTLKDPSDFYRLVDEDISCIERSGAKKAAKVLAEIENKREIPLPKFLSGLGVHSLGTSISELLVDTYQTLEKILEVSVEDLCELEGIQTKTATNVVDGLVCKRLLIDSLLDAGVTIEKPVEKSGEVAGKVFVITGSLNNFSSRKELEEVIKQKGGKISSSVSAKTSYLINNDVTSESGKNKKAKSLNVPIIDEAAILSMVGV